MQTYIDDNSWLEHDKLEAPPSLHSNTKRHDTISQLAKILF
jgi:hypothetical protein